MSNNGFFSHYPFFTPPPQSDQEPVAQPPVGPDLLRDCLVFPEGVICEGLAIR